MSDHSESGPGYVVLMPKGTFALGGQYSPVALFRTRRQAVLFRDELVEHACPKGKVVKVEWTIVTVK